VGVNLKKPTREVELLRFRKEQFRDIVLTLVGVGGV